MIYGNTTDPVEIKTIFLKIWSLRSEIKYRLKQEIPQDADEETKQKLIKKLCSEYKTDQTTPTTASAPTDGEESEDKADGDAAEDKVAEEGDLSNNEDEMAAAIGGGGDGDLSESEDPMAAAMAEAGIPNTKEGESSETAPSSESSENDKVLKKRKRPKLDTNDFASGTTLLSDVNMQEICFFSTHPFNIGQSIVFEFLVPRPFIIEAQIKFCREFSLTSRIISKNKRSFRILANFTFLRVGERTYLRDFVKSVEPAIPVIKKVKKKKADDEDELDDLGL